MKHDPTYSFPDMDGRRKLKELILHITGKCIDQKSFGSTKLNKVLWLSDFISYRKFGIPITGVEYQKLQNGPAPKILRPIRDEMVDSSDIEFVKENLDVGGMYISHRIIPLREPNYEILGSQEIALVDEIIEDIANHMNAA